MENLLECALALCETGAAGGMMRILNILSGFAILITTAAYVHLVQHFSKDAPHDNPVFWTMMAFAVVVGVFSFIGGCLLLRRGR
jgi:hypothetical protein